jgi:hypothetical protein
VIANVHQLRCGDCGGSSDISPACENAPNLDPTQWNDRQPEPGSAAGHGASVLLQCRIMRSPYLYRTVRRWSVGAMGASNRPARPYRPPPRACLGRPTCSELRPETEGKITKLKLVKRQMYGRGKLDLLQARVIGAHVGSLPPPKLRQA